MRIRLKRDILIVVEDTRNNEFWDKPLYKWNEITVETVINNGKTADLVTYDGVIYRDVLTESFEVLSPS
jgi:hypothetical protein